MAGKKKPQPKPPERISQKAKQLRQMVNAMREIAYGYGPLYGPGTTRWEFRDWLPSFSHRDNAPKRVPKAE